MKQLLEAIRLEAIYQMLRAINLPQSRKTVADFSPHWKDEAIAHEWRVKRALWK